MRDHTRIPRLPGLPLLPALPALFALLLGLWGLGRGGSLWGDETVSYAVAHRSLGELWQLAHHVDAVHSLYYLLLHALFALTPGDGGVLLLRLPSVLGIAAAAAGTALLGGRLAGPRVGLAAGLLFPVFPAVQQTAQEGRSYGLVCAGAVWSGVLLLRALDRPPSELRRRWAQLRPWVAYAALGLLTCLLHEFAVLALAAHAVLAWRRPAWWLAFGTVVLGLVPLALLSGRQSQQVAWIVFPGTGTLLFALGVMLAGAACAPLAAPRLRRFALGLLLFPPGALLLVSLAHPVYLDRYVTFSYAGLALLLGSATARLGLRAAVALPIAAVLALLPVELAAHTPQSRPDDLAGAARAVARLSGSGDGVLFLPRKQRLSAEAFPDDYRGLDDLALAADGPSTGTVSGLETDAATLARRLSGTDRVVAVRSAGSGRLGGGTRLDTLKQELLDREFTLCDRERARGLVISAYARKDVGCRQPRP